jgi:hypothetical protein
MKVLGIHAIREADAATERKFLTKLGEAGMPERGSWFRPDDKTVLTADDVLEHIEGVDGEVWAIVEEGDKWQLEGRIVASDSANDAFDVVRANGKDPIERVLPAADDLEE